MGHRVDRRIHSKASDERPATMSDQSDAEGLPEDKHELILKRETPPTSTVVLTVVEAVFPDGSTAAEFTVPTLPATVSHPRLGVVTIPAGSMAPIIVSSVPPPPQTKIPMPSSNTNSPPVPSTVPATVSQPPPPQPSLPSTDISLPSSQHSSPSTDVSLPSSEHSSPSTDISLPSTHQPPTSTIPATPSDTTHIFPPPTSSASTTSNSQPTPQPSTSPTSPSSLRSSTSNSLSSSTQASLTTSDSSTSLSVSTSTISLSSTILSTSSSLSSGPGGGGGGVTAGQPPAPTQSGAPKASSGDDVPKIVGGIVGGVAGIALIIVLLLLLRRVRKRRAIQESHIVGGTTSPETTAARNTFSSSGAHPLSGAVLGGASRVLDKFRPSRGSMGTGAEAVPTQRGFQKLGGRKLASVLETGGDGYDDKFGTDEKHLIPSSGPANRGHEAGSRSAAAAASVGMGSGSYEAELHKELALSQQLSHSPPASPTDRPLSEESAYLERVAIRPSPARTATPVESAMHGAISTTPRSGIVAPSEPLPSAIPPSVRDGIGRSLAAADGSRASRFTEGV